MITHSIRWNLQLWLAFLLVVLLSGFCISMYQLERGNRFRQIDEELNRHLVAVKNDVTGFPEGKSWRIPFGGNGWRGFPVGGPPDVHLNELPEAGGVPTLDWATTLSVDAYVTPEVARLFDESHPDGFYYAVWLPARTLLLNSSNCPPDLKVPDREQNALTHTRTTGVRRDAYCFTVFGDCILVGRNISADLRGLEFLIWGLLVAGGLVLALGLGVGWWLTSRALRPVEEISASASRISEGNLSERVRTTEPGNEIDRLADVLNTMFARLESAFTRQRQFTADASHELRTPLAVIISEAQTTLARERTAAEYRETIEVCLESAQQMRKLADSLLELARFDAGQQAMVMGDFDLAQAARERIDAVRPLALSRQIEIHEFLSPVVTIGDADRIGQIVTNLLTNAMQYGGSPGIIEVRTFQEAGQAVLEISDHGPGIAQEDLPHIFERFYRADKSRARVHGNHGLGLAICKTIVDLHKGTIEAVSTPGQGASLIVKLPVADGKQGPPGVSSVKRD